MKKNKLNQVQRIARLERLVTEMYLKVEAFKVRVEQLEKKGVEKKLERKMLHFEAEKKVKVGRKEGSKEK